jgi:hypothetical protein
MAVPLVREIAAFVAELGGAFGATVDEAVARQGGEPTYFAMENGLTGGTPRLDHHNSWTADEFVQNRRYCVGCDRSRVGPPYGVSIGDGSGACLLWKAFGSGCWVEILVGTI